MDGLIVGSCNDLRDKFTLGGVLCAAVGLVGVLGFDYASGRAAQVESLKSGC